VAVLPKIGGKWDLYLDILTKIQARRGPIKWQSYQNTGQTWAYRVTVLPK